MTSDNDEEESKDITTILTNNTHVLSSNFTSNASYIVHVTATTSAGYGQPSGAVEFTTSVHFQGLDILPFIAHNLTIHSSETNLELFPSFENVQRVPHKW